MEKYVLVRRKLTDYRVALTCENWPPNAGGQDESRLL
jgi:hypothetical protein